MSHNLLSGWSHVLNEGNDRRMLMNNVPAMYASFSWIYCFDLQQEFRVDESTGTQNHFAFCGIQVTTRKYSDSVSNLEAFTTMLVEFRSFRVTITKLSGCSASCQHVYAVFPSTGFAAWIHYFLFILVNLIKTCSLNIYCRNERSYVE